MQVNGAMVRYERALEVLAAADKTLARDLARMGFPWRVLYGDPYWQKHYRFWVLAAVGNHPTIMGQSRRQPVGLQAAPKSARPAIVVGSGPSLTAAIPYLQKWEGDLVASNSNVYFLLAHGITPTHLVVLDAAGLTAELVTSYKHMPKSITLVTHPQVNPTLVKRTKLRPYYFLVQRDGNEFHRWTLPEMYRLSKIDCGLKWRVCVSNAAVQVATYLGEPGRVLFLVGTDFGWRDRAQSRCRTYVPTPDGEALKETPIAVPESTEEEPITRYPDGIERSGDMMNKRDDFYELWWGCRNEFVESDKAGPLVTAVVDCTGGYMHELPQASIADVVAAQGVGWDDVRDKVRGRETADRVADYLNRRVAEKRKQWEAILEARDAERAAIGVAAGDDAGSLDGGDGGTAGQGGAGA